MRVSSSAMGCSNSRKVVFTRSVFYWDRIKRAPEVPGRDRAPGTPTFPEPPHGAQRYLAALEVRHADSLLQPEVVQRKHIRAQQIEDQDHLRRPPSDAAHCDQLGDDLLVRHLGPAMHMDGTVGKVLREVGDVFG